MNALADLSAPNLESFRICTLASQRPDRREPLNIFGGGASELSLVHIQGISAFDSLPPLSSVTTLHLVASCMEPLEGAEFLRLFRNLLKPPPRWDRGGPVRPTFTGHTRIPCRNFHPPLFFVLSRRIAQILY